MKQVHGITSRGVVKNDIRCALLMSQADREAREHLRLSMGRNITYAQFEYDMIPKTVPAIERAYPGDIMPDDTSCKPDYWPDFYFAMKAPVKVTRLAPRCKRVTYGTAALRAAMQAKVRELMSRRGEWRAMQGAISNSQSAGA